MLPNSNIWVTTNEKTIKSELPNSKDYSTPFFETNAINNSEVDSDLLTILISYTNHPEVF